METEAKNPRPAYRFKTPALFHFFGSRAETGGEAADRLKFAICDVAVASSLGRAVLRVSGYDWLGAEPRALLKQFKAAPRKTLLELVDDAFDEKNRSRIAVAAAALVPANVDIWIVDGDAPSYGGVSVQ